ncbi:hypothetical protein AVEN_74175-1 [Araneus ventricosus]|uniref:Uncharacterized protein n=1 Tax=Araneus ventricosus TaxID=182803 RepID=A0A4Y2FSX0_ARAVE|nr:hypothetical protein AVEN_74175-1 [Araneus ventricosus]
MIRCGLFCSTFWADLKTHRIIRESQTSDMPTKEAIVEITILEGYEPKAFLNSRNTVKSQDENFKLRVYLVMNEDIPLELSVRGELQSVVLGESSQILVDFISRSKEITASPLPTVLPPGEKP